MKRTVAPFLPLAVFMLVVLAGPLALLITYAFRESNFLGVGPGPTLEQFKAVFEQSANVKIMLRTLGIGLAVATACTAMAFVLAYAIRFRLHGRRAAIALGIVVAAGIASFLVRVYAWGTILGTNGLLNSALQDLSLVNHPLGFLFFGYFSIGVTMAYVYLPIATLLVVSAMQEIDPRDVEASHDLGAGRWRTALRVVAPQARGGIAVAFAFTAVLASSDYVTPLLVGGARGLMVGALVQEDALVNGNYPASAALAFSFLALLVLALATIALLVRLCRRPAAALARLVDRHATRLTRWVPDAIAGRSLSRPAALLLLAYLILPTLVVVVFSFNSASTIGLPFKGFTLHWYPSITERLGFGEALEGSIQVALTAVVVGVLIGVPAAFAINRATGRLGSGLSALVYLPYAIPGVLLGIAILTAADQLGLQLGRGVTSLVHVLLVAPLVALVVSARLTGMDPRIFEAARDMGASPARVLRTVTLPLIMPAVIGAALIGAAYSLDEILATNFTIGTSSTIPVWLFGQARRGFNPGINALGVMMMAGTLLIFLIAAVLLRRTLINPGREPV
ncbi:MAG: ABC transporter permease subunit [Actinobacteria bacterium]|nr:ABC transporter permease subunit [Actinomycetota bacterium]